MCSSCTSIPTPPRLSSVQPCATNRSMVWPNNANTALHWQPSAYAHGPETVEAARTAATSCLPLGKSGNASRTSMRAGWR